LGSGTEPSLHTYAVQLGSLSHAAQQPASVVLLRPSGNLSLRTALLTSVSDLVLEHMSRSRAAVPTLPENETG
jgi:hypothetical protein